MEGALPSVSTGGVQADHASPLSRGIALLGAGQHRAALDAASDACRAEPGRPEPHYLYGQAWTALGDHASAERAFAEALRLRPDWADAWVNYGVARYRRGAIEEAKTAMRHALAHSPGHAAASANLGAFLRLTGDSEAGEALLRAALAREPANAAARLNLAADLLQEERSDEALAFLDEVEPPAEPLAARHWHLARALAHLQPGRAVEGRAALDACEALGPLPPDLAPLWHWRRLLLALAEGDPAAARAAAEATEAALAAMGPNAVPEHRIMTHYDLAKFRSGRGAHAQAFGHWIAGHKLLAMSQPFSRAAHGAFVEANIARLPRARFVDGPRAKKVDPVPVFIVGMPRSGTTLCEQILAAHAQVHGAGERAALGQAFSAIAGDETPDAVARLADLDQDRLDAMAARYLAELHALAPAEARIVDKMPGNYLYLGLVGLMLPGAKIIHCVRDPRDIGLSIFTFRFHGLHPYAHDLADLGWTIAQQHRVMAHWKEALPNPVMTVALADWVTDFDATLTRVLAHLELPPDPACMRFYESQSRVRTASRTQVRQPVNARGIGRWHAYASELGPLIAELTEAGIELPPPHAENGGPPG